MYNGHVGQMPDLAGERLLPEPRATHHPAREERVRPAEQIPVNECRQCRGSAS